jgi:putative ABC transport system ATP-binding protein
MNTVQNAIDIEEVLFRWPGAAAACLQIDHFSLAAQERVFLHGPSGSGKSTLLSLIAGVLLPQRGRIIIQGKSLAELPAGTRDRFRADRIGFIFQLFNLLPYLSALDNILLPCRFSAARRQRLRAGGATAATEARRLAERLDLPPELLRRPAAELSVGQQQRVAAARALIGRPALVIADEPTSSLDADRQRGFLDLLLAECAAAQAALLFVSHDGRLASHFDRVLPLSAINSAAECRS